MKLQQVNIRNFRSIKELSVAPNDYTVLVGENNAGKSNILRALNLVLGDSWPSERAFSDEDFYNKDTSEPISIQVLFDDTIEEWRNGMQVHIGGFELRCRAYKRRVKDKPAGSLSVEYHCVDSNGKEISVPERPLQKGQKFTGRWLPLRVSNDLRDRAPFIYVDVTREYDKHTPGGRWSVLRRLFDEVNKEFAADHKRIKLKRPDGSVMEVTRREAFETTVQDAYQYLRTQRFVDIEKKLAANALEHMGIEPHEGEVNLHFQAHDPSNAYKSLQLFVNQLGIESPATEVGSGLQSAVVVAIFRTYEEMKKEGAIFAIEEPEVFLHPQRARFFRGVLRRLTESGNQVFLTTHSAVFVDIADPESTALVRRRTDEGTKVVQPRPAQLASTDREQLRLLTEFDAQRSELFFAQKVLLVEGACEKLVLPRIFSAFGEDVNRRGISIIECGGKSKIKLFARVAQAADIPYVVVADHDIRDIDPNWSPKRQERERERNRQHRNWNADLERLVPADRMFYLTPDLEGACGLPRGNESAKVDNAMAHFAKVATEAVPAQLAAPVKKILSL